MDIGFIGLGNMGSGMAAKLVNAGHAVTVYNRDVAKISKWFTGEYQAEALA